MNLSESKIEPWIYNGYICIGHMPLYPCILFQLTFRNSREHIFTLIKLLNRKSTMACWGEGEGDGERWRWRERVRERERGGEGEGEREREIEGEVEVEGIPGTLGWGVCFKSSWMACSK